MCLSQLADVACTKRSFSEEKIDHQPTMEPPQKKVRFAASPNTSQSILQDETISERTPMASSPRELEMLMEKVRQRAERRKRRALRSPPPPPPSSNTAVSPTASPRRSEKGPDDLATMQRKLERMEHAIKKSARMELHLMNQSKKLREERTLLTRKYESMAEQLAEMQRASNDTTTVVFQMGVLPPLMDKPPRRVSANREQMVQNMMAATCFM